MSNLSPGGSRNKFGGRVYGAENIKAAIRAQKHDHAYAGGSIADGHHEHKREIARRSRQAERKAAKRG